MHFLYQTFCKKEISVAAYLRSKGQDVFLPTLDNEALFPSYMFVNEAGIDFYTLNRTPGGVGVVTFGEIPAKVRDSVVDLFKKTEWIRRDDCVEGDHVIVNSGCFNHIPAIFKARKQDRVAVLMTIAGREHELEFSSKEVTAA